MPSEQLDYYRDRAAAERRAAAEANDPQAARLHEEMARHYEALLRNQDNRSQDASVTA